VSKEKRSGVTKLIKAGVLEARNPRIALAYASAFIARSDLVIVGTFVVTWGNVAAINQGFDASQASARGAMLFGVVQMAALLWSPVIGTVLDKVNRVTGIAICMGLAAIGFSAIWFVKDPLSLSAIPYFLLLGVGQISAFFGATTVIGQEAPTAERGAVVGMFNVMGAIGILFATFAGGRLFDSISPNSTFILIGIINALIFVSAVIIRQVSPGFVPDIIGKRIRKLR
jgi:MFS family permease